MKLIILDRDGVINEDSSEFVKAPEEWIPIPESLAAIARLNQAGYRVVILSNQSGIGRGLFDIECLNAMHDKMHQLLSEEGGHIDAIFFCPHRPTDHCNCRKPKPGLFVELSRRMRVPLTGVPSIGDSERDVVATRAAGAWPIMVRTGKGKQTLLEDSPVLRGIPVYADLSEAVDALLTADKPHNAGMA
jgi:D-glycero-D-manno-heptose 1,7-bisphosphate phosphatase